MSIPGDIDALCSGVLLFLESTFILAVLMLLHGTKKSIGTTPLYTVFGLLILYSHLIAAAGIRYILPSIGLELSVASTAIIMPCLALFLMVYILDGTLSAQRMILGVLALCVVFYYLQATGVMQSSWSGPSIMQDASAGLLGSLMSESSRNLMAATVAMLFDALIMPMVYQQLVNSRCGVFISFAVSMIAGQVVDMFIYLGVRHWGEPQYLLTLPLTLFPRALFAVWLSWISSIYIRRMPKNENSSSGRRVIDILLAVFGSYGKAKTLEKNLHESEQRYRTIVQNAGDIIMLTDSGRRIVDANRAALAFFQCSTYPEIIGKTLNDLTGLKTRLCDPENAPETAIIQVTCPDGGSKVEMRVTRVMLEGTPAFLLVGRDVTERERLAKEREQWRTELAHAQRLEAIGRLAGGIAHDFNNYIHSINGQLDLIYMGEVTDESMIHLQKIDAIASQAGKLTAQLLGYARKGRRQTMDFPLAKLVKDTLELFSPESRNVMMPPVKIEQRELKILCDPTQIQQAFLNILINARDAMLDTPEGERKLFVTAGTPEFLGITLKRPSDVQESEHSWCGIRVADTGPGVDPAIIDKIFEPFFTTKPIGMGTGMGLSMAYGVAVEHGGWIQYDRVETGGAAFTIILPLRKSLQGQI